MDWYYKTDGGKVGPVSDKQMLELAELGKINRETMVWNEIDARWQTFGEASVKAGIAVFPESHESEGEPVPDEPVWEPYTAIEPSGDDQHGESHDAPAASPGTESYCDRCFKKFPIEELVRYGAERFCRDCETLYSHELSKPGAAPRLPLAGFCIRLVAKLIDGVIIGIIGMLLYATAVFLLLWTDAIFLPPVRMLVFAAVYLLWLASFFGYSCIFIGKYGATPGKLALGLTVVDSDGGKIGFLKALLRCLSEIISAIPLGVGYIIAAFDPERRTLHDRICGTRVIVKSPQAR